jgi:hypothetical protein
VRTESLSEKCRRLVAEITAGTDCEESEESEESEQSPRADTLSSLCSLSSHASDAPPCPRADTLSSLCSLSSHASEPVQRGRGGLDGLAAASLVILRRRSDRGDDAAAREAADLAEYLARCDWGEVELPPHPNELDLVEWNRAARARSRTAGPAKSAAGPSWVLPARWGAPPHARGDDDSAR